MVFTIFTRSNFKDADALIGTQMPNHAMDDRRSERPTLQSRGARILIELANSASCANVDRSLGGTRSRVVGVLGIPDRFVLQIQSVKLRVRVAWRNPAELRVAFEGD